MPALANAGARRAACVSFVSDPFAAVEAADPRQCSIRRATVAGFARFFSVRPLARARRSDGRGATVARPSDPEFADLVEDGFVADAEPLGSLALVAAGVAQHDDDGLALGGVGGFSAQLLEV